ncbi:MAG: tRNA (guanosine(37)-N1)-methyltransferase TrmD [Bacteriovorax sp.]|nr:tRNA (guanosine(37)-N1)-methyltransferase TrmD [Bacteriovorax sp.]
MKKIWIITLFPNYFDPLINFGITGSALRGERGANFEIRTVQLRNFTPKDYKGVDDSPYGGGAGMVMRADVLKEALLKGVVLEGNYGEDFKSKLHIIFPGPRGRTWDNSYCKDFANRFNEENSKDLVFICGRYEGIDERFLTLFVDEQISIGDYILTGGEIPTMAIIDSSLRFVSGVLGNKDSSKQESFQDDLLEHPQYTRPKSFEGIEVPDILISGHHLKIEKYQKEESLRLTKLHRPDLLTKKEKQ